MQDVIDLILIVIKGGYDILNNFSMTVYGFTFSMWDFLCALFILSCLAPFVVAPRSAGGLKSLVSSSNSSSERNSKDKSDQQNSKK